MRAGIRSFSSDTWEIMPIVRPSPPKCSNTDIAWDPKRLRPATQTLRQ